MITRLCPKCRIPDSEYKTRDDKQCIECSEPMAIADEIKDIFIAYIEEVRNNNDIEDMFHRFDAGGGQ